MQGDFEFFGERQEKIVEFLEQNLDLAKVLHAKGAIPRKVRPASPVQQPLACPATGGS